MSTADEILKAEKPNDDNGWIEYCILKMWEECSVADEYITDNAAAELSALRARVEALEAALKKIAAMKKYKLNAGETIHEAYYKCYTVAESALKA